MAIEKQAEPLPEELRPGANPSEEELMIEVDDAIPPEAEVYEDENGDVTITLMEGEDGVFEEEEMSHDANLAEYMEEEDLTAIALELIEDFEADLASRKDWAMAYAKGLDSLGMKNEERTEPFEGASGVHHPMMMEAVVRFQAQAMGELFPAAGPARAKIIGKETPEKTAQAHRVVNELNYQLTEKMTDYRDELEQLLFHLAPAGSAFKKVYFDYNSNAPCAKFIPAEDFVAPYGASDLKTCERYTHIMKMTQVEMIKAQMNGMYLDIELPDPVGYSSDIQKKLDELAGEKEVMNEDDRFTLLEMHVEMVIPEWDEDGTPLPYVITIDKSSSKILSIRRNWMEYDPLRQKRMHFVHYKYLPGMGFYGIGLIHLLGGLNAGATAILRQLIDAGTLSNLPAGLKTAGMRVKGDDTPLQPGEWRDVDVMGGTLRESLFPLPYKEPSPTLHALLGNLVDEGRRIGSVADVDLKSMHSEAPVGTTLALLERSLKVMSGVQARLHAAMKRELRLIARIIYDYMPPRYDYDPELEHDRVEDFDGRVDVVPVSDPNAATMAQRVVQYQAALQLSQQAPHLYDMGKLHRQMLEVLQIKDAEEIVKLPDDIKPKDPVAENMAILKQEPVKAFEYQDHEAHIQVHMAAAQDPKIQQMVGQSPFAGAIQAALAAHVTEHVAMQYRVEIQKQLGITMPDMDDDEELPEDVEREVSRLAAQAADKLLRKNQAEAAAAAAAAAEKDPLTVIQRKELELKERELALKEMQAQHNAAKDLVELQLEEEVEALDHLIDQEQIRAGDRRVGAEIGARIATQLEQRYQKEKEKGADIALQIAQAILTNLSKPQEKGSVGQNTGKPSSTSGSTKG